MGKRRSYLSEYAKAEMRRVRDGGDANIGDQIIRARSMLDQLLIYCENEMRTAVSLKPGNVDIVWLNQFSQVIERMARSLGVVVRAESEYRDGILRTLPDAPGEDEKGSG